MRIHVYRDFDGTGKVTIIPGRRAHMAPRVISGVKGPGFTQALREVIDEVSLAEIGSRPVPPV